MVSFKKWLIGLVALVVLVLLGIIVYQLHASKTSPQIAHSQLSASTSKEDDMTKQTIQLSIDQVPVQVEWEDNEAVKSLKDKLSQSPLQVELSTYGGFEQVGSLGFSLPSNDIRQKANPGDIMLYTSDSLVLFFGSNQWSYTKLGHIADDSKLADLLDKDSVTVSLTLK